KKPGFYGRFADWAFEARVDAHHTITNAEAGQLVARHERPNVVAGLALEVDSYLADLDRLVLAPGQASTEEALDLCLLVGGGFGQQFRQSHRRIPSRRQWRRFGCAAQLGGRLSGQFRHSTP